MQRSLLLSDIAPIIARSMIGTNKEKVVLIVGIIACLPIFLQETQKALSFFWFQNGPMSMARMLMVKILVITTFMNLLS